MSFIFLTTGTIDSWLMTCDSGYLGQLDASDVLATLFIVRSQS